MENRNTTPAGSIDKEKIIDAWLRHRVRDRGGMYVKMQTDLRSGMPDRLVILPRAAHFFLEIKTRGQQLRPIQQVMLHRLRLLGAKVEVIDTMEKAKDFITNYDKNY